MPRRLSIIVPVYNEGPAVEAAYDAIKRMGESRLDDWELEIIFVDDGSQDDSFAIVEELCHRDAEVKGLRFVANCGAHMAIRAGLEHASGDAACFLACDLQDPPEIIPAMLEALVSPVQVVWAVRNSRQDPWASRLSSSVYRQMARLLVSRNIPPTGSSMVLVGPGPLKMLKRCEERNVALEGIFANMGFPHAYVPYDRHARRVGTSKWTIAKKIKLFIDSILSFSYVPIRTMSAVGMAMATAGFLYAAFVVLGRLGGWIATGSGFAALMTVLLVGQGCTMMMLGVLGEYVWRTYDEVRGRPRYVVDEFVNLNRDADAVPSIMPTRRSA